MNPIGWFEIYVEDMERARKFYEAVFDKKLEKLESPKTEMADLEMWSFSGDMEAYGANGALVKMDGYSSGKNSVIVYFSCEDCAVEEKRVLEAGGKVEQSKFSIEPYGFAAMVVDSEGNLIGLHSMT